MTKTLDLGNLEHIPSSDLNGITKIFISYTAQHLPRQEGQKNKSKGADGMKANFIGDINLVESLMAAGYNQFQPYENTGAMLWFSPLP